ncbi:hypothetical protein PPSIR1_15300 [Plesiocystis pacifica SIR-1]|uniref:Uncharacterized protein n=1 Tax=Plesiocystis pacifica SIR-1 TaxID=391625 RepID=A6GFI5_9BACT|nr:hypothetical protein PPSIR1_15300 [Plesiocystis pacifica SIR-1]
MFESGFGGGGFDIGCLFFACDDNRAQR